MNELYIKRLNVPNSVTIGEASHILDSKTVNNQIKVLNWKAFDYQPKVNFRIGHIQSEIWLKYEVTEKYIRALETRTNGEVYKDSCVEFFVSFDGNNYYNFEFNCIGTIHLAHGPGREKRKFVNPDIIKKIRIHSSLGEKPFKEKSGHFEWELMVQIPLECFEFDLLKTLNKVKATANFYKCGDETSKPHYLTWNPIKTKKPDYHRPEFFGKIYFE